MECIFRGRLFWKIVALGLSFFKAKEGFLPVTDPSQGLRMKRW